MLKTRERIITLDDLVENPIQVLDNAQREPLVLTQEGRPAAYLLSVDLVDALLEKLAAIEQQEMMAAIATGKKQFDEGEFISLREAADRAKARWQQTDEA